MKKEKSGQAFEKLVTVIQMAFNPDDNVKHNIKKRENSGVNRQIDVSIEGRNIIVECKDHNDKVNLAEMGAFIDLCNSTNSEGIFVSRKGFSKNCLIKANFANVKTYTVDLIRTKEFKDNFRKVPKVCVFTYYYEYKECYVVLPNKYSHLVSARTDDNLVYENETDRTIEQDKFPSYIFGTFSNDFIQDTFVPLLQKVLPGQEKPLLDKKFTEDVLCEFPKNRFCYKYDGELVPLQSMIFKIDYWLEFKHRDKSVFHQKDANQNIVSQIVQADMTHNNLPYSMSVVETGVPGKFDITMIPKFLSSEIIKLKNLGELKKSD